MNAMWLGRTLTALAVAAAWLGGPGAAQGQLDPQKPVGHFRVENPAGLTNADALVIYRRILDDMVAGYRLSAIPFAGDYRSWRRFNTVPYRSAQHGERFVNNYGNDSAGAYRRFESSGTFPVGSILVKDSFAVTRHGDIFSGPLFTMEKMAAGFDPENRDWRYSMIMPDGSIFGISGGEGADRIEFCGGCHQRAGDRQDHLFYVPPPFRMRTLN